MNWHKYYYEIAKIVASKSKCLSRQIGAVLVANNAIISTGYNGPPRGTPHCGEGRLDADRSLREILNVNDRSILNPIEPLTECPRYLLGHKSSEGLYLCPATHAEANCICQAAMNGISTYNTTMYVTCGVPCKSCLGLLINAGVKTVVCTEDGYYDDISPIIVNSSNLQIVRYDFE